MIDDQMKWKHATREAKDIQKMFPRNEILMSVLTGHVYALNTCFKGTVVDGEPLLD